MKLLRFKPAGEQAPRTGVWRDGQVLALPDALTIETVLASPKGLRAAHEAIQAAGAMSWPQDQVQWLLPVAAPEKIWCIGVNYRGRNEEYRDNSALPRYPSLFVRGIGSFSPHGQALVRPRISEQLDYEGELVLVIGKAGRHIPRERAFDHIAGMTLANEGSVRDWLRHGKFNVTQGKNFDQSGSLGPWIVTADELDPRARHVIRTRVNGELRQEEGTDLLMFPFDALIAYLSTFATLRPGDLILTGTPVGTGARLDPPQWLAPGDVVEVESPGIGVLRNVVVQEE